MHSFSPSSSNASTFTSYSSSPPGTPPDVFVPDDFKDDAAPPRRKSSPSSGILAMFSRIDSLMSPARLKHEAAVAKWHKGVKAKMTQAQASPTLTTLHDILDDEPLLEHDVGKHAPRRSPATKMGKKSPGARLASAIAAAVRSEQRSKNSYLVKPEPTLPSGRCAAATKAKTPPKWRRSPRILKQLLGERERGTELAHKNSRWAAAVGHSLATRKESPGTSKRSVSWAAVGAAARDAARDADALDEFMQRPASEPRAVAAAVAPQRSDLQALCRAKRREVLLEMGVSAEDLHPTLRGYAPRPQVPAAASGDALSAFMSSYE